MGGVAKTDACEDEKKDREDPLGEQLVGITRLSEWGVTDQEDVDGEAKDYRKGAHSGGLRL